MDRPWLLRSSTAVFAAFFFSIAFLAAVIYAQNPLPLIDSDAMTYHAPAALEWLRTGRLTLFPVWFFNPANTFSPLAGSAFIAWLIAPLDNDVLARAVQAPALILLFLAAVQLTRALGASAAVAALVATAVVTSRPFNSETMAARDDVFLTAFLAVAVAGCARSSLLDGFSPWRIGIALGLAFAIKYTALFAAPIVLLLVDAPKKGGWRGRDYLKAGAVVLLLAGPWYLRNLFLTGNPLYPVEFSVFGHPIFPGLVQTLRTDRLRSLAGVNDVLLQGFHGPTPSLAVALLLGWIAAAASGKAVWRDPLLRVCVFGFPACLALFLLKAPYGEVRFLFPAFLLLFVVLGAALARWIPFEAARIVVVAVLLLISIRSAYKNWDLLFQIAAFAFAATGVALAYAYFDHSVAAERRTRLRSYSATAVLVLLALWLYVYWPRYLKEYQILAGGIPISEQPAGGLDDPTLAKGFWNAQYPDLAPAWTFVRDNLPEGAAIAYTNTYLVYPLYGSPPTHRVFYVPTRADVPDFLHLPHFATPLPGESIVPAFAEMLAQSADRVVWMHRLSDAKADYLFIVKTPPVLSPPELAFAIEDAARFTRVFEDAHTAIFRVAR